MSDNDTTFMGLFLDHLRDTAGAHSRPWLTQYRDYQPQGRHASGEGANQVAPWLAAVLVIGLPLAVFAVVSLILLVAL